MTFDTRLGVPINAGIVVKYIDSLVNRFFKILPIKEKNEDTLQTYMESLQLEMLGGQNLVVTLNDNKDYFALLAILQFLIDNPDVHVSVVRREVFKAISICEKLKEKLDSEGSDE